MARRERRVVWSDQARGALDEALEYIAQDSPEGARAVLEQALATASSLATLYERGRVVPELSDPLLREIFVFRYRLLYEIAPTEIRILNLLHGARDFARWRKHE